MKVYIYRKINVYIRINNSLGAVAHTRCCPSCSPHLSCIPHSHSRYETCCCARLLVRLLAHLLLPSFTTSAFLPPSRRKQAQLPRSQSSPRPDANFRRLQLLGCGHNLQLQLFRMYVTFTLHPPESPWPPVAPKIQRQPLALWHRFCRQRQ